MINDASKKNISFGSTYVIDFNDNPGKYSAASKIEDMYYLEDGFQSYMNFPTLKDNGNATYVAPNKLDKAIETHLKNSGINFERLTKKDLFNQENIKKRIILNPRAEQQGYKLIELDTKKFDDLFKLSIDKYVGPNGKNGFPSRYSGFREYLKSNQPIHSSIVNLLETEQGLEVCFTDGRHRYSVLRDMGFKSIPLSLDPKSIELAKLYKLII